SGVVFAGWDEGPPQALSNPEKTQQALPIREPFASYLNTWHRRLAREVSRGTGGSPVRFKVIEASQTPSSMPSTLLLENLCRTFLSKMLSRSRALRERSGLLHHLHSSHCSSGGYFVAVFLPRRYSCTPWAWTLGEPCPPLLCGAGGSPAGPCGM